jgi:hypothetical protein
MAVMLQRTCLLARPAPDLVLRGRSGQGDGVGDRVVGMGWTAVGHRVGLHRLVGLDGGLAMPSYTRLATITGYYGLV